MSQPEVDKPRSSITLHFDQNSDLVKEFTGTGLGDRVSMLVTGKVTRIDEYGVSMDLKKISTTDEMDDDEVSINEDSLDDSPISAVLNVNE